MAESRERRQASRSGWRSRPGTPRSTAQRPGCRPIRRVSMAGLLVPPWPFPAPVEGAAMRVGREASPIRLMRSSICVLLSFARSLRHFAVRAQSGGRPLPADFEARGRRYICSTLYIYRDTMYNTSWNDVKQVIGRHGLYPQWKRCVSSLAVINRASRRQHRCVSSRFAYAGVSDNKLTRLANAHSNAGA